MSHTKQVQRKHGFAFYSSPSKSEKLFPLEINERMTRAADNVNVLTASILCSVTFAAMHFVYLNFASCTYKN